VSDQAARPDAPLPLPLARMFVHNVGDCHKKTLTGGIDVFQALQEKDSKAQNVKVLSFLASTFVLPAPGNSSSWSNNSCLNRISPPSVETFVLNTTLLI
jgi:hypothetical protein